VRLKDLHIVYFLGIGGIGMSALARWFKYHNQWVAGYDRTPTDLTKELEGEGISVNYDDEVAFIPDAIKDADKKNVLVIYTPAVPKESRQLNFFTDQNFLLKKRSEVLGMITRQYNTVAVAGTHGKTTTSSMIAHLLHDSGKNCLAFLGGITQNYHSNLIINKKGDAETIVVAEADEYDRSFLALHPNVAVITSADADHLDIYGNKDALIQSMKAFIGQIQAGGLLVINDKIYHSLVESADTLDIKKYSLQMGDAHAENVRVENAVFVFDYVMQEVMLRNLQLMLPGYHNVENAIAAITVALHLGLAEEDIRKAILNYKGVKRRFEYILKGKHLVFVDDYAHHPAEIEAFLLSLKALYPGRKITAIFQPHLFTRTRDFADGFSDSLSLADEVILLDIYPARELPIEGVDAEMLMEKITSPNKTLASKDNLIKILEERQLEVVATIGAGDIDKLVKPVKELLKGKYHAN
jgi:UDP-N-acetylmuramate--alanine ligase